MSLLLLAPQMSAIPVNEGLVFDLRLDITVALPLASGVFDMFGEGSGLQQNFPGGFKGIDVCLFADGYWFVRYRFRCTLQSENLSTRFLL